MSGAAPLARMDDSRTRAVAKLARLALTDAEITRYSIQLTAIFDYMRTIQGLDTDAVEPFSNALPTATTRLDAPRSGLAPAQALANAPDIIAGCFRVPAFLSREHDA